ncbi:T-cell surface antigen CD2-like isoform X2 [Lithobates pipiens]
MTSETCLLRVLLLWALLWTGRGKDQEIFTRPGSDLLIPIRIHLTLNPTDTGRCDQIDWYYKDPTGHYYIIIQQHERCRLWKSDNVPSPNTRLSENGSLIISNVSPENDGKYRVDIYNSTGDLIQRDYYTVHVEVPVSDPVLDVRCLQNGSAEISCWVENGTDPSIYLTVSGGLEVYNVTSSERTVRVTVPPVSSPDSWNIRCSAKNNISERSTNQTQDACPVKPCLSCLWKSLIGGFLVLLVTMPPIFIAHWYLLRGIRRNLRPSTQKTRRNNPSSMMRQ